MSILDALLARLGYVKLGRYGLALTPEGRIVTLRGLVLDDGYGTHVVGWRDQDLAPADLHAMVMTAAASPAA
ncbi:MAG: hypothetical protein H6709_14555, partial [Kofleriaceae bacterium]|nr:hypothetical protein [Kofleriaceae bacterium]